MRARQIVRRQSGNPAPDLPETMPSLLQRVYAARAIDSAADLDYALRNLDPPGLLGGLDAAVDLLEQALRDEQRILVVGDFDADGATSTALCLRALRGMGARDVHFLVPNRFEYGYGLTPEIVAVAAGLQPDLIMTVDNGISSIAGVEAARQRGIRVLITDHHLPGTVLPPAEAIVNPNSPGDEFPSKNLAGVGVAFYVMLALRARLRRCGWFEQQAIPEPNLGRLLDLVALGTVADVVPLDRNNRILVQHGIQRIRSGQCVPGIRALLEVGQRNAARTVSTDLAFAVGPRLNAAGRLEDMSVGIECLLTDSAESAREMAARLDALNRDRKEIESDMQTRALEAIQELHLEAQGLPTGLCLFEPDWHQGVIGILAARIKEQFHRPVIAFARVGNGELKGSARSIPGFHIRDALDAVAAHHPKLITRFGGHAMAAGLTLDEADYPAFAKAFDAEASRLLSEHDLNHTLYSDGELQTDEFSLETAQTLREAGPWGQDFPAPVFDGRFRLISQRVVGERHLKLLLQPLNGEGQIDAISFNTAELPGSCREVRAPYQLDVNEYRGILSAQLVV
ncbi:MAG: single-stranded-DNA-specific exonuclease RecJ, partial [Halobacteria archaeon]|nr:single-stranded-DNA-specific exonuclease RecJ [Halobacteria archaeon]